VVKRIALLLALVGTLALALASAAWAVTSFGGRFETGGTVSFKLLNPDEGGGLYKVKGWEWDNLKIKCRNGKHRYDGKFKGIEIDVDPKLRTFREKAVNNWNGKAILNGLLDEDYANAEGTFKIKGRTSVGRKCRSGVVGWTAQEAVPPPTE
jgi:hypothetical protein